MAIKYKWLTEQLRQMIQEYIQNGLNKLPSEQELCFRYHVSRQTVRKALNALEEQGVIRRVHHQEGNKEHSLVAALQIQELFGLDTISGKVGGNDVHVIPGSDRFLLFLNGHFLQVRHFSLDVFSIPKLL